MYKQTAFQMVPMLINEYPDLNELIKSLGDTEQEKMLHKRAIEEILINMGQTHYMHKENEAALKCFEECLKFVAPSILVLYFLGLVNQELGNIDIAENNFGLALDLSQGQFSDARLELSNLLLKHRGINGCEEAIQHLCFLTNEKQHPKIDEVYFRLLFALEQTNQYNLALKYMKKFTEMKPNNIQGLFEVGRIANFVGEHEMAENSLRNVLVCEPRNYEAKYQLALSLYNLNASKDEVKKLLNQVLLHKVNHIKALQLKSKILINEKNLEDALNIINKILEYNPNLIGFYQQKAIILEKFNDNKEIFIIYRQIILMWKNRMMENPDYFIKFPREYEMYKKICSKSKKYKNNDQFRKFKESLTSFQKEFLKPLNFPKQSNNLKNTVTSWWPF